VHLQHLEKQEQAKPNSSRWREITKIRVEINENDQRKLYKEPTKQKVGSLQR
jgi:hypothetical protein